MKVSTKNQKVPQYIINNAGNYKRTKGVRRINRNGLPIFDTSKQASEHKDRPKKCQTRGCNARPSVQGGEKQGYYWLMWCSECCKADRAKRQGFKDKKEYKNKLAKDNGFLSHGARSKASHKYLKFRKDYCENKDARLGFKCTTTIINPQTHPEIFEANENVDAAWNGLLHVDHINGDPSDNREENLQTLCVCCHTIKTALFEDYKTAGRKTLKC